jgi:hypothetical protein
MALTREEIAEIEGRTSTTPPAREEGPEAGGTPAYPEASEVRKESALGILEGLARSGPLVAGGMTGAKIGLTAAPFLGPAAPAAPVIGLGAGLIAGYMGGQGLSSFVPKVSRPELAPYREGGVTFGESIAFSPVAFGIPVMTGNRVAQFISGIGEAARKYPKVYLTSETLGSAGAGVGGGVAVAQDPESAGRRFTYEVAGGFFAPGRFVVNMSGTAVGLLGNLKNQLSPAGRQNSAAVRIYDELEKTGEDIAALIKRLEAPTAVPGAMPTSAQKTGSPTLSALETKLAQSNAKFGGDNLKAGQDTMLAYQSLIDRLRSTGRPEDLRAAAALRKNYFEGLLNGRLAAADADSGLAISKISKDTPAARVQIGEIVKNNTRAALRDAREYERTLWSNALRDLGKREVKDTYYNVTTGYDSLGREIVERIPTTQIAGRELTPGHTVKGFMDLAVDIPEIVYKSTTPPLVRKIMESFGVTDDVLRQYRNSRNTEEFMKTGELPITVFANMDIKKADPIDLLNYRTQLLDLAREASGKGEVANARFYGQIAENLLQDLNRIESPAFDAARQFSKELNDVFTRTFADEITAKNIKGGDKIPAEILVQRAFGSNADVTSMRMRDVEDAAGFMQNKYASLSDKRTAEAIELRPYAAASKGYFSGVRDAQTQVLRLAAAQSIGPDGRLNVNKLNKFITDNKPALDRMGITPDLQDAVQAENMFKAVSASNSKLAKVGENQTAFARLLKYGSPVDAVGDALNSRFPVRNMANMAKLAQKSGMPAVEGLRSTVLDYAYTKALRENGTIDANTFKKALFEPIRTGQPSLINIMRSQDIMSATEVKNLRRITDSMDRVEYAMKNRAVMDDLVKDASALDEFVMRLIGVTGASQVGVKGPGQLVIAGAGSQAARNIFGKMPNLMVRNVMEQAAQDPVFMAQLLKRGQSQAEKVRIARQLHAYLGAAGLNYADFEEPPPEPEASIPSGMAASQLRNLRPAPQTRGVPGFELPMQQKPGGPLQQGAPAPGPQSAAPTSSRQMLASLFPFDTISGMGG